MHVLSKMHSDQSVIESLFAGLVFASSVTIPHAGTNRTGTDTLTRTETGESFAAAFPFDQRVPASDHWSRD